MDIDGFRLLTERQAAHVLRIGESTLRGWRVAGTGPPHFRLSARTIRYRLDDLHAWVQDKERKSTCDRRGFDGKSA